MKKRAQLLPVFVMLALFLILSLSLMYYVLSNTTTDDNASQLGTSASLDSQTNIIKSIVQDCLEEKVALAADKFCGLSTTSAQCIEQYIQFYFSDCFDPETMGARGIDLKAGQMAVKATPDFESLQVDMEYPLTIQLQGQSSKLSSFKYFMPLTSTTRLDLDSEQKTTQEIRILSQDGLAELVIPAGTKITNTVGGPVAEISLRVADKHKSGLTNNVVMSNTIYDGQPEGIQFEPAVTLKLKYTPGMLYDMYESDLKLGWYDESAGIWKGLPSSSVDVVNKIVSAKLSHFTNIGPVKCTTRTPVSEIDTIEFSYKNIITEPQNTDELCTCSCAGNCSSQDGAQLKADLKKPMAIINFTIPGNGDGCVMEKASTNSKADIRIELLCSAGDNCAETLFSEDDTYKDLTSKVIFNPLPTPDTWTDTGLKAGLNQIYFSLEDTSGDACAFADAKVHIRGLGITYSTCDSSSTSSVPFESCNVQDAINTLCGKGDPVYNDIYPGVPNCERDSKGNPIGFLDPNREGKLISLIRAAQAINPATWRSVFLTHLTNKDDVLSGIGSLGLTLTCSGLGGSGGISIDSCQAQGGQILDSMEACKAEGGWPLGSSSGGSGGVCCKTEGCCVDSNNNLEEKNRTECIGDDPTVQNENTFIGDSCSNIKGCCTWESNTKCWIDSTKARCDKKQGTTFYYDDTQCSKYPSCEVQEDPTSEICEFAKQYLGCPYSYSSNGQLSPANCQVGLTCATFVASVFTYTCNQGGILTHGAWMCNNLQSVSESELQPGDIFSYGVVDESDPDPQKWTYGHTGIYCGNGIIIHSNSIDKRVVEDNLEDWYNMDPPSRSMHWCRVASCDTAS